MQFLLGDKIKHKDMPVYDTIEELTYKLGTPIVLYTDGGFDYVQDLEHGIRCNEIIHISPKRDLIIRLLQE